MSITVLEYVTQNGKVPIREWLSKLKDVEGRAKIRVRINRIRLGNFGDVKFVAHGVFELRLTHGPGYRIYFAREGEQVVLLLCGGDKSTQQQDINRAVMYWRDYQER